MVPLQGLPLRVKVLLQGGRRKGPLFSCGQLLDFSGKLLHCRGGEERCGQRKSKPFYICMVKPSGHRTVRVDVGVVEGSSLSEHNIAINMQLTTKLRLQKFTSGWDPLSTTSRQPVARLRLYKFPSGWDPD